MIAARRSADQEPLMTEQANTVASEFADRHIRQIIYLSGELAAQTVLKARR